MAAITLDQVEPGMVIRYQVGGESRHAKLTNVHPIWKDGEPGFEATLLDPMTHKPVPLTDGRGGPARGFALCWGRLSQVTHLNAEPAPAG